MRFKVVGFGFASLAMACGGGDRPAQDAAAQGQAPPATPPGQEQAVAQTDEGARVYGSVCVTCHQPNGEGLPGAFPPLSGSSVVTGDPEMSIKIVLHGLVGQLNRGGASYSGLMTPWGPTLSDQEIADVLTYVRSNFGNEAAAVTEAQVAAVRAATAGQTSPFTTEDLGIVDQ